MKYRNHKSSAKRECYYRLVDLNLIGKRTGGMDQIFFRGKWRTDKDGLIKNRIRNFAGEEIDGYQFCESNIDSILSIEMITRYEARNYIENRFVKGRSFVFEG